MVYPHATEACDSFATWLQEVRSHLRVTVGTVFQLDSTAAIWAVYVKELTDLIARNLPDFWHAPQVIVRTAKFEKALHDYLNPLILLRSYCLPNKRL